MRHFFNHRRVFRAAALVLMPLHVLSLLPAPAAAAPAEPPASTEGATGEVPLPPRFVSLLPPVAGTEATTGRAAFETPAAQPPPRAPRPPVTSNHTIPKITPPAALPHFSSPPTDLEIFRARIFEEPLVPSGTTSAQENTRLADALNVYLAAKTREEFGSLETFLAQQPRSVWEISLKTNLGIVARHTGYFTKALAFDREAWESGKAETDPRVKATADRAVSELAELYARLGRTEDLEALLAEVAQRDVSGSASERLGETKQSLYIMKTQPGIAYRCGPMAVEKILAMLKPGSPVDPKITDTLSTSKGTSLLQVQDLATSVGLKMRMAIRRSEDAPFLVPAVVHWKAGHFAAIVRRQNDRYLLQDPTFGEELWVTEAALKHETSGAFLVVDDGSPLPSGWDAMAVSAGAAVWGKGAPPGQDVSYATPEDRHCCEEDGSCPSPAPGMAYPAILPMLASLVIRDTPVGYAPPMGPAVRLNLAYNQREAFQPQIFAYSNVGSNWTFEWFSYVTDDPANPAQTVTVYRSGGGQETYTGYNAATQSYAVHFRSHAVVVRTATSPVRYERRLPDGSTEVFSQPDGSLTFPRKVLLTSIVDPQGLTLRYLYDDSLRLVAIVDALGQVTTLFYDLGSDPLKITRVADPFGRTATLGYDPSGRLARITDVIGLVSEFTYDTGNFISSLTTPYGTSRFQTGQNGADRWIQATDPLGGIEKTMYVNGHSSLVSDADPPATVPTGFAASNNGLDQAFTLFWDKRASMLAPNDYSKAESTHWLWSNGTQLTSGIRRTTKKALENRVWFAYPGESFIRAVGSSGSPSTVARVLDDGTSQNYQYEYNSIGHITRATDPVGRSTLYEYAPNGIDQVAARQVSGQVTQLLLSAAYNSQHRLLTTTDAAANTWTYTYNSNGKALTEVTPARAGISETRTATRTYDGNGYLQSVTRPAAGAATAYTYDAYGRLRTVSGSEGYSVTTDYDALDRPTKVTYPDGTYVQTTYDRLDVSQWRDRRGAVTEILHDALRRPIAARDALGRTTVYQWCNCGSLDSMIDGNRNVTTWTRDLEARITAETKPDNAVWLYGYENTTSRLKTRTDPKSQATTYTYFTDNNLHETVYTNTTVATPTVSLTYDQDFNRLSSLTDGIGTTTYAYYPITGQPALGAGKLQSVSGPLPNSVVTYTYDELGRIVGSGLATLSSTASYDALGRVGSLDSPVGTFGWTYVNTTRRAHALSYPNGQVTTYSYLDAIGDQRLQGVTHQQTSSGPALSQFNYTYDVRGNVTTWRRQDMGGAATLWEVGYDAADEVSSVIERDAGTQQILRNWGYTYDLAGNKTGDAQDSTVTASHYNRRNQLTQQTTGAALPVAGSLNEPVTVMVGGTAASVSPTNQFAGTLQGVAGAQNFAVTATDSSGNTRTNSYQVTLNGGAQSLVYDANGNLCAKAGTTCTNGATTYEWDAENRLVDVKQGSTLLASFVYDGTGRRIQKIASGVTHSYVYDRQNIIEERLSSGQSYDYVQRPGIDRALAQRDQAGTVRYYLADRLGSITQMTTSAGVITLSREYDPWGNALQGAANGGYAFTGRDWDPRSGCTTTGLDIMTLRSVGLLAKTRLASKGVPLVR